MSTSIFQFSKLHIRISENVKISELSGNYLIHSLQLLLYGPY